MQEVWPWVSAALGFLGGAAFFAAERACKVRNRKEAKAREPMMRQTAPASTVLDWSLGMGKKEENALFAMLEAVERYDGGKER